MLPQQCRAAVAWAEWAGWTTRGAVGRKRALRFGERLQIAKEARLALLENAASSPSSNKRRKRPETWRRRSQDHCAQERMIGSAASAADRTALSRPCVDERRMLVGMPSASTPLGIATPHQSRKLPSMVLRSVWALLRKKTRRWPRAARWAFAGPEAPCNPTTGALEDLHSAPRIFSTSAAVYNTFKTTTPS